MKMVEKYTPLARRLDLAHKARRAKEHQLDDIRQAHTGATPNAAVHALTELADLHRRGPGLLDTPNGPVNHPDVCAHCRVEWPCATGLILTRHQRTAREPGGMGP